LATVLLTSIGHCASGDTRRPLLDADSVFVRDGPIAMVGRGLSRDAGVEQ